MGLFLKGLFGGSKVRVKSLPRLLYPVEFLEEMGADEMEAHLKLRLDRPPALRTVLGQLHAVWRHSTESRLSKIDAPTLLVRPSKDILIRPTQTDRLAERIPSSRVLRFDDAGHGVTFQKARELNAALRERHIFGGKDISGEDNALGQSALYCVTEVHTAADIRKLSDTLKEVLS